MDLELEMEVTRSFSSVLSSLFSIFLGSTHKAALARSRPILPLHLLSHRPLSTKTNKSRWTKPWTFSFGIPDVWRYLPYNSCFPCGFLFLFHRFLSLVSFFEAIKQMFSKTFISSLWMILVTDSLRLLDNTLFSLSCGIIPWKLLFHIFSHRKKLYPGLAPANKH